MRAGAAGRGRGHDRLRRAASAAPGKIDSGAAGVIDATGELVSKPVSSPDAVRDYWTRARMRDAEPAELRLGAGGRIARPSPGALTPASAGSEPPARSAVDASADPDRVSRPRPRQGLLHDQRRQPPGRLRLLGHGGELERPHARLDGRPLRQRRRVRRRVRDQLDLRARLSQRRAPVRRPGRRASCSPPGAGRDDVNIRLDLGAALLARDGEGRGIEDVIGARGIAFNRRASRSSPPSATRRSRRSCTPSSTASVSSRAPRR